MGVRSLIVQPLKRPNNGAKAMSKSWGLSLKLIKVKPSHSATGTGKSG